MIFSTTLAQSGPDGFGPFEHAAGSPFQIPLMGLGPMFLESGEAARPPTAPVGRHALAVLKEFDGLVGQTHVQLLVNELIRSAVEVVLHRHMIVNVDLGLGPVGQLEGRGGQRQQPAFFQRLKPTVARAFQLLERLLVQLGQERTDGGVQLAQVEKTAGRAMPPKSAARQ
jgi:hypothetical protein